jgi:hypothetical protein
LRRGGNLLEIEFNLLPAETFMLVPVLYDENVMQKAVDDEVLYSETIKFKCEMYVRQSVDIKSLSPAIVIESGKCN